MLAPDSRNIIDLDQARWRRLLPRVPVQRRPCTCPACAWDRAVLKKLDELQPQEETPAP